MLICKKWKFKHALNSNHFFDVKKVKETKNKIMKNLFVLIAMLIVNHHLVAQSEIELITQTLTDYIEGSTNGQPTRLKKAFHPDLNLYAINKDQKLSVWSGTDYIADTKEGKPTGETGTIISIDYENDAAVAKVEIAHPESKVPYVDYFMLLKLNGQWTIIHKMYTKRKSGGDEIADITATLMDYIDGTGNGEPARITRAFHEDLNLYAVDGTNLMSRSGKKYITYFQEGKKSNRIGRIISIDFENNAATAKIEILMPGKKRIYTDYLLLLKFPEGWKIIHKSYTYVPYHE